jgi:molybdopterin converting factor small subunit
MFLEEEDYDIKSMVIGILAKHSSNKIVPYLLSLLKSAEKNQQADAIQVCGNFNDISLVHYLLPFLKSDDPVIKSRTIVALWKFKKHQMMLLQEIKDMLFSKDKEYRIEAYYILGEINALQEKNRLIDILKSDDDDEKLSAATALAKMNIQNGIPVIIKRILQDDSSKKRLMHIIHFDLDKKIKDFTLKLLNRKVSSYINHILSESHKMALEELDTSTLMRLRNAYELVNEHEEVENIDRILRIPPFERNKNLQFNPA